MPQMGPVWWCSVMFCCWLVVLFFFFYGVYSFDNQRAELKAGLSVEGVW